jgi:hypothetical protein
MASANVTLGSRPHEFEVDTTIRTATLNVRGGWLRNTHASESAYVNFDAGTVTVTQPAGASGAIIKAGQAMQIPPDVGSFTFDAGATTYLQYSPSPLA